MGEREEKEGRGYSEMFIKPEKADPYLAADGRWQTERFCEKLEQDKNSGKKESIMTAGNTEV